MLLFWFAAHLVTRSFCQQTPHDALMKSQYSEIFNLTDTNFKHFGCRTSTGVKRNGNPGCCQCDENCFIRNDCCLDVDYAGFSSNKSDIYFSGLRKKLSKFSDRICLPVIHNNPINTQIEYVSAIYKCADGTLCIDSNNTLSLVRGSNSKLYANEKCTKCNGLPTFTYPEIGFKGCINRTNLLYLQDNRTNFDMRNLTNCRVILYDDSKISCPFGKLSQSRPQKQNCSIESIRSKCWSYFGIVKDQLGYLHANPMCGKCSSEKTKLFPADCKQLRKRFDFSEKSSMLVLTSQSDAGVFIDKNDESIRLKICAEGVMDLTTLSCKVEQPKFYNKVTKNIYHKVARYMRLIKDILAPITMVASLISLFWTLVTFVSSKEFNHCPGRTLMLLVCIMVAYHLFSLMFITKNFTTVKRDGIVILLRWCFVTKYLFIFMLAYHWLRFIMYMAKSFGEQCFHLVVQTTLVLMTSTILIIASQSQNNMQLESFHGRLYLYLIPIFVLLISTMILLIFALRQVSWTKQRLKRHKELCESLEISYKKTMKFVVLIFITDSFYTVHLVPPTNLYTMINEIFELFFLTLNGMQGVFVFTLLVVDKETIELYKRGLQSIKRSIKKCFGINVEEPERFDMEKFEREQAERHGEKKGEDDGDEDDDNDFETFIEESDRNYLEYLKGGHVAL